MKLKKSKKLISSFIRQCKRDNDSYLIVHFSVEEDDFYGLSEMEGADALIIIRTLIKGYKLDPKAVYIMNKNLK